ncbi:hypothetical protein FQZ97_629920 [compost metagenome]
MGRPRWEAPGIGSAVTLLRLSRQAVMRPIVDVAYVKGVPLVCCSRTFPLQKRPMPTGGSLDRRTGMLKRLIPLAMLALIIAISGSSCDNRGSDGGGSQQSEPSGGSGGY